MKIAMVMYPLDNLGGIVSNVENGLWGLKECGHDVDFFLFAWQGKFMKPKFTDEELIARNDGWYNGFCCAVHQWHGWNFPLDRKIAYKGKENLERAKSILKKYDFVIWQIPVPTRQKVNQGNTDWIELYKANDRNIIYSHDAHMIKNYPYLYEVKDYLCGMVGVNLASYNSLKIAGVPRIMIFSSHDLSLLKIAKPYDWHTREKGFLAPQTFKGWKHVEDIIRAIPYMGGYKKFIAGGGREQAYMVSKDKAKPEYICDRKYDPDLPKKLHKGISIWERAEMHGMEYLGFISPRKRNFMLKRLKTLIDPSWNLNFAKHGDHFNRTFIDAIKNGALPIGRNFGISTNKEGKGFFFKPEENYIMIPHDATPKEFAELTDYAQNLSKGKVRDILKNNYNVIGEWDRVLCAKHFVDLAEGKPSGYFRELDYVKRTDPSIPARSEKMMREFFGFESVDRSKSKEGLRGIL